jgi:hypothetical protein
MITHDQAMRLNELIENYAYHYGQMEKTRIEGTVDPVSKVTQECIKARKRLDSYIHALTNREESENGESIEEYLNRKSAHL